jgi:ABC-type multidrug transport system fused ATPase/permease subunit
VLNADQIMVLDQGKIAAIGNHEYLLETNEIYAEIYHSQLVEDIEPDPASAAVSLEA